MPGAAPLPPHGAARTRAGEAPAHCGGSGGRSTRRRTGCRWATARPPRHPLTGPRSRARSSAISSASAAIGAMLRASGARPCARRCAPSPSGLTPPCRWTGPIRCCSPWCRASPGRLQRHLPAGPGSRRQRPVRAERPRRQCYGQGRGEGRKGECRRRQEGPRRRDGGGKRAAAHRPPAAGGPHVARRPAGGPQAKAPRRSAKVAGWSRSAYAPRPRRAQRSYTGYSGLPSWAFPFFGSRRHRQ